MPLTSTQADDPRTVRAVIDRYLNFAAGSYSARALRERVRILEQFCSCHGSKLLSEAKPVHLADWLTAQKRWRSDHTRRATVQIIQRPMNWAVRLGLIERNPFAGFTWHEGEARRPITDEEFAALLRHTDALFRRVLCFLRWTGARPGEMAKACWPHVDFARAVILLREHKTARRTRRPRVIPLAPVVLRLLCWMRPRAREPDGYLFTTQIGTPWNRSSLSLRFQRLRRRAGVARDVTPHCCRHAFATQAVLNGANLSLLSKALGHSSVAVTSRYYVHVDGEIEAIRAAAELGVRKKG